MDAAQTAMSSRPSAKEILAIMHRAIEDLVEKESVPGGGPIPTNPVNYFLFDIVFAGAITRSFEDAYLFRLTSWENGPPSEGFSSDTLLEAAVEDELIKFDGVYPLDEVRQEFLARSNRNHPAYDPSIKDAKPLVFVQEEKLDKEKANVYEGGAWQIFLCSRIRVYLAEWEAEQIKASTAVSLSGRPGLRF